MLAAAPAALGDRALQALPDPLERSVCRRIGPRLAGLADKSAYAVTLERGTDGSYLGWVDELPGCAVRADSREQVLERLPAAICDFLAWAGVGETPWPITVAEEIESAVETEEDTEILVSADRNALTEDRWNQSKHWLERSREELLDLLTQLTDNQLAGTRGGSERTIREEIEHVALVELMYTVWTFDLQSRGGLAEFLAWTRRLATERLSSLAADQAADVTWADWGGAPRLEPWTPRKAARRLVWHELLHVRAIERFTGRDQKP
jgi:predicted RNase H-like HicB family nuclease